MRTLEKLDIVLSWVVSFVVVALAFFIMFLDGTTKLSMGHYRPTFVGKKL